MFQVELQFDDIAGPSELDMTRIPEFPASSALQSIEGQNLKGAAFDVLQAYQDQARMADERHQAFYTLARETGIPAAQLQPMVDLNPDLLGPRPGGPAAVQHMDLVSHISRRSERDRLNTLHQAEGHLIDQEQAEAAQAAAHGAHMSAFHMHYGGAASAPGGAMSDYDALGAAGLPPTAASPQVGGATGSGGAPPVVVGTPIVADVVGTPVADPDALSGRQLIQMMTDQGMTAEMIQRQLVDAGVAASFDGNFPIFGQTYRVTAETMRQANALYAELFPEERLGARVSHGFQEMAGGVVAAGGRLGRHGLAAAGNAAGIGGRATLQGARLGGQALYGVGSTMAHIGTAAAGGNHAPAVAGLAGASIAASAVSQAAAAATSAATGAAAHLVASSEPIAAGLLLGSGIYAGGRLVGAARDRYEQGIRDTFERWLQQRRIQQAMIGPDAVPAMAAPPVPGAWRPHGRVFGGNRLGVPDGGPGAPMYGPPGPPAAPAAAPAGGGIPPAAAAPAPAAAPAAGPAMVPPGAPLAIPSPAAISAHAAALRATGNPRWWYSNVAVAEPEYWQQVRYRDAGGRVQNFWKHRGGPALTDRQTQNLVDHG